MEKQKGKSIYVDLKTAALLEEINIITRLPKAEIARQAFTMFKNTINGKFIIASDLPQTEMEAK